MKTLSLQEIEKLRVLVFDNAKELLEEANILFTKGKYARAYALAHLSSEELAKLPILATAGIDLANGATIDWKKLSVKLRSHEEKLKGLLFIDFLGKGVNPTAKEIQVHKQSLSRVCLLNDLKNVSLYAGVYQDSLYKPSAAITEVLADQALTAARNRLELYSSIESVTHGRIAELANRASYLKLLKMLCVGENG